MNITRLFSLGLVQRTATRALFSQSQSYAPTPSGLVQRSATRALSSQSQPDVLPREIDPYKLVAEDLKQVYVTIRKECTANTMQRDLDSLSMYYFKGHGKGFRPMVILLMAKALNYHLNPPHHDLLPSQRQLAVIAEMIHSASLIHDDMIDQSDTRRGKPSINTLWNHKEVTMAGDFVLSISCMLMARVGNDEVSLLLSQILKDLVQGEFMQLGSRDTENERFAHYLTKTYRKTASLIANFLKATAVVAGGDAHLTEIAYQYGRNLGLAFQLVDDLLDFVSTAQQMGKPTATDLRLGLATAPVLFACEQYPELNEMIMRRFEQEGDVDRAFQIVHQSDGISQTRFLANKYCSEALKQAKRLKESEFQKALLVVGKLAINRMK